MYIPPYNLIQRGLVRPYGDNDWGEYWPRLLPQGKLVPGPMLTYQEIPMSQEVLKLSILNNTLVK